MFEDRRGHPQDPIIVIDMSEMNWRQVEHIYLNHIFKMKYDALMQSIMSDAQISDAVQIAQARWEREIAKPWDGKPWDAHGPDDPLWVYDHPPPPTKEEIEERWNESPKGRVEGVAVDIAAMGAVEKLWAPVTLKRRCQEARRRAWELVAQELPPTRRERQMMFNRLDPHRVEAVRWPAERAEHKRRTMRRRIGAQKRRMSLRD